MKKYFVMVTLVIFALGCGQAEDTQKATMKKSSPGSSAKAQSLIATGMESLNNQDITSALKNFDEAIKIDPQNADNYMVLGQVYLRLRNYDRAVDTFNAGTRVAPDNGELYYFLGAANAVRHAMSEDGSKKEFYLNEGILAAKKSVEIFVAAKDEEKFKRAVVLLKSLQEGGDIGTVKN